MVVNTDPGAYVTILFTAVIYHNFLIILSFCVIKLYYLGNYLGNYHGMAVNYQISLTLE